MIDVKKNLQFAKNYWAVLFNVFVIIALGLYLFKNLNSFKFFVKNINFIIYVKMIFLSLILLFISALTNMIIINALKIKVRFSDVLLLQFSSNFLNKIFPKLGSGYKAYFLKKKYAFPYTKFISMIAGIYIINIMVYSLLILASLLFIYVNYHLYNVFITLTFFTFIIFSAVVIIFDFKFNNPNNHKLLDLLNRVANGWDFIKNKKSRILMLTFLVFTTVFFVTLQLQIIYRSMNYNISFFQLIYLSSIGLLSTIANITPDGIGLSEALYATSHELINENINIIIFGSLISRLVRISISFVFGGISYLWLNRDLKKIKTQNN